MGLPLVTRHFRALPSAQHLTRKELPPSPAHRSAVASPRPSPAQAPLNCTSFI